MRREKGIRLKSVGEEKGKKRMIERETGEWEEEERKYIFF